MFLLFGSQVWIHVFVFAEVLTEKVGQFRLGFLLSDLKHPAHHNVLHLGHPLEGVECEAPRFVVLLEDVLGNDYNVVEGVDQVRFQQLVLVCEQLLLHLLVLVHNGNEVVLLDLQDVARVEALGVDLHWLVVEKQVPVVDD